MNSNPPHMLVAQLRDRNISLSAFRAATHQLAQHLARETATHLTDCSHPITLVPILRSGLALLPIFLEQFPNASVGILGLRRNTKVGSIEQYFCNMPALTPDHRVIILDPLIATGKTACAALSLITQQVPARNTFLAGILSASQGISVIATEYPETRLIIAANDPHLDEGSYIVPGLGDFGNRYFGTRG